MSAKKDGAGAPEKRPPLVRERTIPPDGESRAELVRALTRMIKGIETHLRTGANWRDRRRLDALRRSVDARGNTLELLRADAPAVWEAIVAGLNLETPNVQED